MASRLDRLKHMPSRPPEDRERPVIQEGTEILGGILLTRAGIVVDTDENPGHYRLVLEAIDARLSEGDGSTIDALRAVNTVSGLVIPQHDEGRYSALLREEADALGVELLGPQDPIGLSRFMGVGGICHQGALLEAAMLRLMQLRGDIDGEVSLESSFRGPDHPDRHTRTVFTEAGRDFLLINGGLGVFAETPRAD